MAEAEADTEVAVVVKQGTLSSVVPTGLLLRSRASKVVYVCRNEGGDETRRHCRGHKNGAVVLPLNQSDGGANAAVRVCVCFLQTQLSVCVRVFSCVLFFYFFYLRICSLSVCARFFLFSFSFLISV